MKTSSRAGSLSPRGAQAEELLQGFLAQSSQEGQSLGLQMVLVVFVFVAVAADAHGPPVILLMPSCCCRKEVAFHFEVLFAALQMGCSAKMLL